MDQKKIIIGLVLFFAFIGLMMYQKKKKEEEEAERLRKIEAGEIEPVCEVISVNQFDIEKTDWYWWMRRSNDQQREAAYQEFKQASDGYQKHPSYWRWAHNKVNELGFCMEEV